MSRPAAADGNSISDASWSIYDAQAFRAGRSATVHKLGSLPSSVTVTAVCGLVAYTDYFGTYPDGFTGHDYSSRPAVWAGDAVSCRTCLQRGR
jgi:hypothetical protein